MSDDNTLDTTIDEWQAELQRFKPECSLGKTLWELSEELGLSPTTMRLRLLDLIKTGRCTYGQGQRTDKRGRRYNVAVYQLIPQKKTEKQ